jgi:hypothetical protein
MCKLFFDGPSVRDSVPVTTALPMRLPPAGIRHGESATMRTRPWQTWPHGDVADAVWRALVLRAASHPPGRSGVIQQPEPAGAWGWPGCGGAQMAEAASLFKASDRPGCGRDLQMTSASDLPEPASQGAGEAPPSYEELLSALERCAFLLKRISEGDCDLDESARVGARALKLVIDARKNPPHKP